MRGGREEVKSSSCVQYAKWKKKILKTGEMLQEPGCMILTPTLKSRRGGDESLVVLSLEETEAKSEFCSVGNGGQREGEASRLEQSLATDDCPEG